MKVWLWITVLWMITACNSTRVNREWVLSGKSQPGNRIEIKAYEEGDLKNVAVAEADAEGRFNVVCPGRQMGWFTVAMPSAQQIFRLIAAPGEKIFVDLSGEHPVFQQDGAERNRFLQELEKQKAVWGNTYPAPFTDVSAYRKAVGQQYAALRQYLEKALPEDREARDLIAAEEAVLYYGKLLRFPFLYQLMTGTAPDLPEGFYDFVREIDLSSPHLKSMGNINSFLQELFTAMETSRYLQGGEEDYLWKRAALIGDSVLRESYLLYVVGKIEMSGYNQYLGRQMEKMDSWIVTPESRTKWEDIQRKYAETARQNERLNAGQEAFDFTGADVKGKKHRLSDYRGKVVVVDVWNTGCKPCIAEIPYLKKLERQFAGREVVFISYSLETQVESWEKFLGTHQMEGNQWINTEAFKSDFAKNYKVRFIPRFMVFGKQGEIVEVYAPRPSNPRLASLIERELKK